MLPNTHRGIVFLLTSAACVVLGGLALILSLFWPRHMPWPASQPARPGTGRDDASLRHVSTSQAKGPPDFRGPSQRNHPDQMRSTVAASNPARIPRQGGADAGGSGLCPERGEIGPAVLGDQERMRRRF